LRQSVRDAKRDGLEWETSQELARWMRAASPCVSPVGMCIPLDARLVPERYDLDSTAGTGSIVARLPDRIEDI
jgi:hypothetical protein